MTPSPEARGVAPGPSHQISADALPQLSGSGLFSWLIRTAIFTMVEAGIDAAGRLWTPSSRSTADI